MYVCMYYVLLEKQWVLLLPAQILKNTEQIAYKIFVQNLKSTNSSLYEPPTPGMPAFFPQTASRLTNPSPERAEGVASGGVGPNREGGAPQRLRQSVRAGVRT